MSWPIGQGGKGNEGVAATVKQVPNSIGYVEYAYAKQNSIPFALLQNKAGQYPAPDDAAFQAAAANADWSAAPGFGISLTNQPGDDAWPITGGDLHPDLQERRTSRNSRRGAEVLRLGLQERRQPAADLDYVPLPDRSSA